MSERVTVSKQDRDWVAECVAHEWFVYTSDQPLAYELAAGHVCMEHPKPLFGDVDYLADDPTVCIAHGRFVPCRRQGEHRHTTNPYWVKAVADYQSSNVEGLSWAPAWERS